MIYGLLKPLLFQIDPETTHRLIHRLGQISTALHLNPLLKLLFDYENAALAQNILGLHFKSPVGLAAGFDKNGDIIDFMAALGFGFVEIGSVTARPWSGNPRPRLFRLPQDRALINRMGLNNRGAAEVMRRLQGKSCRVPLGINVTKTPDPQIVGEAGVADFCEAFEKLHPLADYLTLNISCPNTAEGKTFEDPAALTQLLTGIRGVRGNQKPVLVKISPDLDPNELEQILEISEGFGIVGYVIGNTSARRPLLKTNPRRLAVIGKGGLSGKPLNASMLSQVKEVRRKLPHTTIIGCGGIFDTEDVHRCMQSGANLVQIYTGLVYQGPSMCRHINRGLMDIIE